MGTTGGRPPAGNPARRRLLTATQFFLLVGVALVATAGAVSFQFTHSTETAGGEQNSAEFLTHWQQTSSEAGTMPRFLTATLSAAVGTPTRLAGAAARYGLNAGTAGHVAVLWIFSETVGTPLNTEFELTFAVHDVRGTTAQSQTTTAYVETQATAITGTVQFTIYFDTGAATGITYVSQLELSQVCSAVGTCP